MNIGVFKVIFFLAIPLDICLGQPDGFPPCLLFWGVSGFILRRVSLGRIQDDPCESEQCSSRGRCSREIVDGRLSAKCLCEDGYCGDSCELSNQLTGEVCPCALANSICVENRCVCRCGYTLVALAGDPICALDCPNGLSDEFTAYPGKEIDGNNFSSFQDDNLANLLIACRVVCISNPLCRSYEIDTDGGDNDCKLQGLARDDVPLGDDGGSTYFQRECKAE